MSNVNPRVAWLTVLAALLLVPACTPGSSDSRTQPRPSAPRARSTETSSAIRYPPTISLADTATPRLAFRQFELPAGSQVTDYTEHIAAYSETSQNAGHVVFGLLDLASGAHRIVLEQAVNAAGGYSVHTPKLSDSWLVWEEVSPDEEADPRNTTWRLYAARIDANDFVLGKPRLVDEGRTDYKLRPHYAVLDSKVFWSVNKVPSPRQEYVPRSGAVESLDLVTVERRTVLRTNHAFPTFCATNGLLSMTETLDDTRPFHVRARLFDPETARILVTRDLDNEHPVSHFVRASDEWLSWAVFPGEGAAWPSLYFAPLAPRSSAASRMGSSSDGPSRSGVLLAGIDSIDPAFFGRYAAFESLEASMVGTPGGITRRVRRIWLADPERRTRAPLLETREDEGWWQTCASARPTNTLLLWNDLGPWIEDQAAARTLVRIYRALE